MRNLDVVCLMSLVIVIIQGIHLRPHALNPQNAPRATAMFLHRAVCRNTWPLWPLGGRLALTAGLRSLYRCTLVLIGLASTCDCGGRISCWISRGDEPVDAPLYSVVPLHADFAILLYSCWIFVHQGSVPLWLHKEQGSVPLRLPMLSLFHNVSRACC